ncbi:hypothetical protein [Clostridium aminobutyricum]|uniref:Uncharacterized protein n=1 Tax=Clostridium aminobutyricum TaxID=33953 RepID=A0A939D687_CLOAM|nr:hypothetical protein [Clostridium aminobutyricum]MBN7771832.1 hypothetical protein [Clostridium aminobutyricum]
MEKRLINKETLSNIAHLIYHSDQLDIPMQYDYEQLINNDLSELNKQLHSKLSYDDAENLFNMIIDYGENKGIKDFEEGMITGIRLYKELIYT